MTLYNMCYETDLNLSTLSMVARDAAYRIQ